MELSDGGWALLRTNKAEEWRAASNGAVEGKREPMGALENQLHENETKESLVAMVSKLMDEKRQLENTLYARNAEIARLQRAYDGALSNAQSSGPKIAELERELEHLRSFSHEDY